MRWPRSSRYWNPQVFKLGFNIKFTAVALAQHGITLRNHDDAQLMSYALDAGRNAHGLEALAERWLGHAVISYGELTGSGKNKLTFDQIAIDESRAEPDPSAAAQLLAAKACETLTIPDEVDSFLERVRFARIPEPTAEAALQSLAEGLTRLDALEAAIRDGGLLRAMHAQLPPGARRTLDELAPEKLKLPGGRQVRYRMTSRPLFVHCCHCRWCQRETGAAFALNAMIEADRVQLLAGGPEAVMTPSASGKGQKIWRCPECRVSLWSNYSGAGDAVRFVRVGTLDNPDAMPPDIHIFTMSKQPWVVLPEDTPAVAEFYDIKEMWPKESLERRAAMKRR